MLVLLNLVLKGDHIDHKIYVVYTNYINEKLLKLQSLEIVVDKNVAYKQKGYHVIWLISQIDKNDVFQ